MTEEPGQKPAERVVYVERERNTMAAVALTLALIGLVLGLIPILFWIAWAGGIAGFVLGLVARRRAGRNPALGRRTMATWAAVLGIAAFGIGCAGYAILTDAFDDAVDELDSTADCLDRADTAAEIEDC